MLLKDLPIGTRVVDNDTKYFGEPIVWLVADKNHKGYPNNSVTLISDKVLCLKCFDAPEKKSASSGIGAANRGNGVYRVSNINSWLNSGNYNWYYKTHSADMPPSSENFQSWEKIHFYTDESGFLTNLSSRLYSSLLYTSLTTIDFETYSNISAKPLITMNAYVFLPSEVEINDYYWKYGGGDHLHNNYNFDDRYKYQCDNDEQLQIFKINRNFKETTVSKAFIDWAQSKGINYGSNGYLSRSSYSQIDRYVCYYQYSYNTGIKYSAACTPQGIRPVCNVTEKIEIFDKPDSNGIYTMKWNQPPSKPDGIVIPDKIRSGKPATISWGVATDPDGESVGYGLDRQIDNNSWSRIYNGAAKEFTDNIVKGWNTVGYRVAAYDRHGAGSGYVTGETKTVINNEDPIISTDVNSNLGIKTEPFKISYIVDDADEERNLTVREYLDDNLHKEYTAPKSYGYDFQISKEEWREVINGEHTIKIVVEDSEGGTDEKVFTFSKNETSILLELKTPLEADDMVTKAIININRTIPPDAKMTVYICNNAFDDNPTWQNVTHFVLRNAKILILNETKTADKWGVNIRVEVERNGATGDCFISSIGGVFE